MLLRLSMFRGNKSHEDIVAQRNEFRTYLSSLGSDAQTINIMVGMFNKITFLQKLLMEAIKLQQGTHKFEQCVKLIIKDCGLVKRKWHKEWKQVLPGKSKVIEQMLESK